MNDTAVDLTDFDGSVLDASLTMLYRQHEHASNSGDKQACAEIHYGISQIVAEQARRTDEWIETKRDATETQPQRS
jgi:hypothetical protein